MTSCIFCQTPGEIVCNKAKCQREMRLLHDEEEKMYQADLNLAVEHALIQRCKHNNEWNLNRFWRWFYTLKLLICVMLNRTEPRNGNLYPNEVDVAQHHYRKLYAGWEARWISVGHGIFTQWWFAIRSDGDWNM